MDEKEKEVVEETVDETPDNSVKEEAGESTTEEKEEVVQDADDTAETLQRRVMEQAEWVLLPQAAELLAAQIVTEM